MYVNDWTVDYGPRGREAVRAASGPGGGSGFSPAAQLTYNLSDDSEEPDLVSAWADRSAVTQIVAPNLDIEPT